jgi:uncharacterized membrane protein
MKQRLLRLYDMFWNSFWIIPALMAVVAAGAAVVTVLLDRSLGEEWVRDVGMVWAGSAEGARGVLAAVAGSIMTVVSIVFSLTITTLAQTSSHFGPRVLRNFTSNRGNQLVLGTFIATFVYCLLVLRTVRSTDATSFVPHLSVNIGVLLALASLGVLIYYIHHIAQSIQAENLIAGIGHDFQNALRVLFPEHIGSAGSSDARPPPIAWDSGFVVTSDGNGYLQRVAEDTLIALACKHDLVLRLEKHPGEFVVKRTPLLRVLSSTSPDEELAQALRGCFGLGLFRTPHQDAEYSIQQLVEIAVHAMSPGINEPYTALTCIDWLAASLRGMADRKMPAPVRRDGNGTVRVVSHPITFDELVAASFDQIRLYSASNADVMCRLLDVAIELAPCLRRPSDVECLKRHAGLIEQDARQQVTNASDRQRVVQRWSEAMRVLNEQRDAGTR